MKNWITSRLKIAHKSWAVWALAIGIAVTQALPSITDSLPLAQQAFSAGTYQLIVRALFIIGIVLRIAHLRPDHDHDHAE